MDRGQQAAQTNLLDREGRIVAEILERFRNVVLEATSRVSNRSSTVGHSAYSAMHMEIETRGLIKSTEDLLSLTRQLRELWVVGPLHKPGEGEREASERIDASARRVAELLDGLRERSRAELVGGGDDSGDAGAYVTAPLEPPRFDGPAGAPQQQQQQQQQPPQAGN